MEHKFPKSKYDVGFDKLFIVTFIALRKFIYALLTLLKPVSPVREGSVIVLCYHSLASDNWKFSVNFQEFTKQINYLLKSFVPISVENLEEYLKGNNKITKKSFLLCFDDGYKDILSTKDILAELKIKPIVFVLGNSEHANRSELETQREFLSNEDIVELKNAGWDIGSHSATHANLIKLSAEQLKEEIIGSKQTLEKNLGFEVKYFAYPKGQYNKEVLATVEKAGYEMAFSMDDGYVTKEDKPLAIPRIGVDRSHSFYEFKIMFSPLAIFFRKVSKKFI